MRQEVLRSNSQRMKLRREQRREETEQRERDKGKYQFNRGVMELLEEDVSKGPTETQRGQPPPKESNFHRE